MNFGLIIIGDEILSGRRTDKHLSKVIEILNQRGQTLSWAEYLGDDPARIFESLRRSRASKDVVFCTGGIGATPDDHTRQCAAKAFDLELALHPEAKELILARIKETAGDDPLKGDPNNADNRQRLKMGEFPVGAGIIPNPYNRIPGFSLENHHFFPGFPIMAWPMMEWVLDEKYKSLNGSRDHVEKSFLIFAAAESTITPLMEKIEAEFPSVKVFSLPSMGDPDRGEIYAGPHIEIGTKGPKEVALQAYKQIHDMVSKLGFSIHEL